MKVTKNKKDEEIRNKIKEKIEERKLDIDKIDSVFNIYKELMNNEEGSVIAVNGKQGSGKSTVIDLAIEVYGKKHKKMHMNIWNLFGHRNKEDYDGKSNVTSYNNDGKINSVNPRTQKVSKLFYKKTIWKSIYSQINWWRKWKLRSVYGSQPLKTDYIKDRKISTWNIIKFSFLLFFVPLLSFLTLFIINSYTSANIDVLIQIFIPIIAAFVEISTLFYKNNKKEKSNNVLVNQISNQAINRYIGHKSKKRFFSSKIWIIHITELDRFYSWLEDGDEEKEHAKNAIISIVEMLTLAYKSKRLNMIIELDQKILDAISKSSNHPDISKKVFTSKIDVRKWDLEAFSNYLKFKMSDLSNAKIEYNENLTEFIFNSINNNILQNEIDSWRVMPELINVYKKIYKKYPELLNNYITNSMGQQFLVLKEISNSLNQNIKYDQNNDWVNNYEDFNVDSKKSSNYEYEYWAKFLFLSFMKNPSKNLRGFKIALWPSGNEMIIRSKKKIMEWNWNDMNLNAWPLSYVLYLFNLEDINEILKVDKLKIYNLNASFLVEGKGEKTYIVEKWISNDILNAQNIALLINKIKIHESSKNNEFKKLFNLKKVKEKIIPWIRENKKINLNARIEILKLNYEVPISKEEIKIIDKRELKILNKIEAFNNIIKKKKWTKLVNEKNESNQNQ